MLIDSHAHLNFRDFKDDFDEVIKRSLARDVWLINVGSNYQTSKKAVEIAEKYPKGVWAAIGLHPIHARDEDFDREKYKELVLRSLGEGGKVAAIGEIGLDYYKDYGSFKDRQKGILSEQISLAQELNLPIIFHCRKAHKELLEILNYKLQTKNYKLKGAIHCFSGSWSEAKKYLGLGFYLGFNGIIYKLNLREVIEKTPLERILIETDCPYLAPPLARRSPKGEGSRNEPIFVKYIAREIAAIKKTDFRAVADITTKNAKDLFFKP